MDQSVASAITQREQAVAEFFKQLAKLAEVATSTIEQIVKDEMADRARERETRLERSRPT